MEEGVQKLDLKDSNEEFLSLMDQMLFDQNSILPDLNVHITNVNTKPSLITCNPITLDLAFDFI